MADPVAAQHQHRDVDHGEDAQQKQRGRAPSAGTSPAKMISPAATRVVKMIAVQGVRRVGWTCPRTGGSTDSRDIPYTRRLAISMLISAVLATANSVMTAKIRRGKAGAPASTTCSSGVSPRLRSAGATSATAASETST